MSGEASKRSGELGEALAKELLRMIGWSPSLSTIKIPCALQEKHGTTSHGDDRLFIYNSPFLEGVTDVVHVSVKHQTGGYALAHDFGDAWVDDINIGFEDYNESIHSQARDQALIAFEHLAKNVSVFSYKVSLLSLLEGQS